MEDQKPFDVRTKLAQELGRVPPETKSSPEDYAPKRKPEQTGDEYRIAQEIKHTMRSGPYWNGMPDGQCEALDLIATEISRICVGRDFWKEIIEWATLGQEEAARD